MSMGKQVQEECVIDLTDEPKCSSPKEMEDYWKKRSIYLLPASVTDLNKEAYEPKTVSFGPYHHGKAHLKAMEEHKHRALRHFLKRSNKPLQCYIDSLAPVVQELKDSYDSLDATWKQDTNAFLLMMILDGCFMLEILRAAAGNRDNYAGNDPIFSNHGKIYVMPYIKHDMLMIENQLPMRLLHNLLQDDKSQVEEKSVEEKSLNERILKFLYDGGDVPDIDESLHVLDVYRKSLLFKQEHVTCRMSWFFKQIHRFSNKFMTESSLHRLMDQLSIFKFMRRKIVPHKFVAGDDIIIRSASELHEAGIKFKKSRAGNLKDVKFENGVLTLPYAIVDEDTKSMFLNLIAFERCHVGAGNEVTSYICFMNDIIDDAKDVRLLRKEGIMDYAVGSDKDVAELFNSLFIKVDPDTSLYIFDVYKGITVYCKKPWNKWRANLCHTYFTNPWVVINLLAAILLFALTIIQTIYTVYPYYHPA